MFVLRSYFRFASELTRGFLASSPAVDTTLIEFDDIANSITIAPEYPTNRSGHFCDLLVGVHEAYGRVALKRPRLAQQDYTGDDVRVGCSAVVCS